MIEGTRIARVQATVAPLRQCGVTHISSLRSLRTPREAFCSKQRMMASAVREERRPGLFVFAAHAHYGHVARLWLEASPTPRAGTIGRHDAVDLALPLDDALSLRHLLFVVRRDGKGVRFQVIDLETSNGLRLENDQRVRLAEASGPLILCASDFFFFCVPTGQPVPWDCDSPEPWASLKPRVVGRQVPHGEDPAEALAGRLEVNTPERARNLSFSSAALRRGVLIGRADRCDVVIPVHTVSRVHVVLLQLDDGLWVMDAGSTNGTWRDDEELKIARMSEGAPVRLGNEVELGWHAAH